MTGRFKLVCFDLDGTLIDDSDGKQYWTNLHHELCGDEGKKNEQERTRQFFAGEITYKEWVDLDLGNFQKQGRTKEDFEHVARKHTLITGVKETITELHTRGYKLAVISGSLLILIDTLFPEHPFDDIYVNKIHFNEQGLIESWKDTVYDQGSKHKALLEICDREHISVEESVFVGDGENDIDILQKSGLGIAFSPKSDKVRDAADVVVEKRDMREILQHLV